MSGIHRPWVQVLVLLLACGLVFANTLHNGLHLDDHYRVDNPGVTEFWPPWRHFVDPGTSATVPRIVQYRPLLPLTLSITHALGGGSVVAHHLGNLACHAAASVFFLLLARELLAGASAPGGGPLALLAAAMFAVHPVSGITVNYICSRDLGLMQMFLLGGLWWYVRMRRRGVSTDGVLALAALFLGGLLSKTNAALLPVLLGLYEVLLARRAGCPPSRAVLPILLGLLGLAGLLFLLVRLHLGFSDAGNVVATDRSAWQYAARQAQAHVFHYLRNFAWPFPIRQGPLDPPVAWQQVVGAACIAASLVFAARALRRRPLAVFCVLGYLVLLAPTSSVVPLWADIVAYRPYPSSPFLFLGVALLLGRGRWGRVVLCALVAYFGAASVVINRTWRDEATLWRHSVAHGGDALAYLNLAMALPGATRQQQDVRRGLLQEALRQNPRYIVASINLGLLEIDCGDVEPGLARIRQAVAWDDAQPDSWYWLARAAAGQGRFEEAAAAARTAAELLPRNTGYQYLAGRSLQVAGQVAASLPFLERVMARDPDHEDTRYLYGFALQKGGQRDAAVAAYEAFVARHPGHDAAWFNLGYARMEARAWRPAIDAFDRCLASNPGNRPAHAHLATCYRAVGDAERAARHQESFDRSR